MADFCKQCSVDMFGEDFGEFRRESDDENLAWLVLCEGCGPVQVNRRGECISGDCLVSGHAVPHKWKESEE
jgi:hypothetical protein